MKQKIKVLEITPKYNRVHEIYPEFYEAITSVMRTWRYAGIYKSMSEVIKTMPKKLKDTIKSGKKNKKIDRIRGRNFDCLTIDEIVKPKYEKTQAKKSKKT